MPQFLKLMLYNEINLSVRFQDSFSHVWEHSRFIIGTVIKQTLVHKEALLGKNKIMYSESDCNCTITARTLLAKREDYQF